MVFATERVAWVLPLTLASIDVFRAAVLSIVLAMAVGPNVSLLCDAWCHPAAARMGACEHRQPTSAASLSGRDCCPDIGARPVALVRDDVRRWVSPPPRQHAIPVPSFQLITPSTRAGFGGNSGTHPTFDAKTVVSALRL